MTSVLKCRRTFVALFAIVCLTILGLVVKAEVAGTICTVAIALAGANSAQAILVARKDK